MPSNLKANAVVERLVNKLGASSTSVTNESFECGDGGTVVTGIITAWTPTLEVLRKAVATQHNFIIAMEPPYWHETGATKTEVTYGPPSPQMLEASPAYQAKKKLIDEHGLVIWRFQENYAALPSNPRLNALASALGYDKHLNTLATQKLATIRAGIYSLPETTLLELARKAKAGTNAAGLRIVGNPQTKVSKVALKPGYMTDSEIMAIVQDRNVDVIVCGEACEWEAFVYAEDWITVGWGKGLIMLGRAASEDPGYVQLATWIKSLVSEVPVTGLPVGEPFNYIPSHKA